MPNNPPLLLLKTPSPTPASDPYTTALSPHFTPHYVPVLTHTLHPDPLIKLLLKHLDPLSPSSTASPSPSPSSTPTFPYGAILLTSQRSVAALSTALSSPVLQQKLPASTLSRLKWVIYVVGPATARAAWEVVREKLPACVVRGEGAGNGEALAGVILGESGGEGEGYEVWEDEGAEQVGGGNEEEEDGDEGRQENRAIAANGTKDSKPEARRKKPILFLTGEKRRDVLPRTLQSPSLPASKRIKVDEMVVYNSAELQEFEFHFQQALRGTVPGEGQMRWTVVFSPQGGRGMLRGLGLLGEGENRITREKMEEGREERRNFVCCIGPSTRAYLRDEFGFEADVVAERPSPEGVREGIGVFMERSVGGEELTVQGDTGGR